MGGQDHFYLEPHCNFVQPIENDEFILWASTQVGAILAIFSTGAMKCAKMKWKRLRPSVIACWMASRDGEDVKSAIQDVAKHQKLVSKVLGIPHHKLVSKTKRLGGGFGGKETRGAFLHCATAVAAYHTRRPVRLVLSRQQDMQMTGHRHAFQGKYKVAASAAGDILALDLELYCNAGAYETMCPSWGEGILFVMSSVEMLLSYACLWTGTQIMSFNLTNKSGSMAAPAGNSVDLSHAIMDRAILHSDCAFKIPNLRITGRLCRTNQASNTAFRGFGGPQGMLIANVWMDHLARELSIPLHDLQARHLYTEGAITHFGQTLEHNRLPACWEEVDKLSDWSRRRADVEAFNAQSKCAFCSPAFELP
jgi:xanthine dehydrogenase/oxidase